MCDPFTAIATVAGLGFAAKSSSDQRKAAREAAQIQQEAENRKQAALERKGPDAISNTDTAAADAERKRRTAVMNRSSVLTSRKGALGMPSTAGTSLTGTATRSTMG